MAAESIGLVLDQMARYRRGRFVPSQSCQPVPRAHATSRYARAMKDLIIGKPWLDTLDVSDYQGNRILLKKTGVANIELAILTFVFNR